MSEEPEVIRFLKQKRGRKPMDRPAPVDRKTKLAAKAALREAYRQEVLKLKDRFAGLSALTLLGLAENPESPLHKCFEWDDARAAHQY